VISTPRSFLVGVFPKLPISTWSLGTRASAKGYDEKQTRRNARNGLKQPKMMRRGPVVHKDPNENREPTTMMMTVLSILERQPSLISEIHYIDM
jgi:hypothetical protein